MGNVFYNASTGQWAREIRPLVGQIIAGAPVRGVA